ncbi:MAG: methylated-DNA--[protein]-cysteine S-methyltransferase [Bryobacteraceae bacterium]|jgi:methylated-DNA-[protein]-cysteine S-methyltransferase
MRYCGFFQPAPLFPIRIEASERGITRVSIGAPRSGERVHDGEQPLIRETAQQLAEYFSGRRRAFDLPLDLEGTAFQREVWEALRRIPYGETCTYGELARAIGRAGAARAAGAANGANPVAIIVPCHRVLAARGGLGGYTGGLERKRFLLELERGSVTSRTSS